MNLNDKVFNLVYNEDANKYSEFQDALSPFTVGMVGITDVY